MTTSLGLASMAAMVAGLILVACPLAAPAADKAPARPQGPRLTDAALLGELDLSLPELRAVREAARAKDYPRVRAAWGAYLRKRPSRWWFDAHKIDRRISHNRAAADKTVAGQIEVIGIWHTFPGGEIDWFYNPTIVQRDLPVNHEWLWQLGRMNYWPNLGRTYWATGDETYAKAFVRQLRSWVHGCRRPSRGSGNVANSAWRTIECGIRMRGSWPDALHRFLTSPSVTDDDLWLYLACCVEHAMHLRQHHRSGGNWLTMEMAGLYTVGAVFPELKQAKAWRAYAIATLHKELNRQFTPDGAQIELTPGYHQVALVNILHIPALAQQLGLEKELPADFIARSEKAFDYDLFLMTPDRDMPKLNDSWHVNVPKMLRQGLTLFPKRSDFAWVASGGRKGEKPAHTSHAFPYAGYLAMRSSWRKDANFLALDAGPLGAGHVHQDKLNVVLWAYGREALYDGGGGQYEQSPYRRYAIDTFSHNTILVDGQPQRRSRASGTPGKDKKLSDMRWQPAEAFDFAAGAYDDAYGKKRPAVHTRRVLFVKPDVFVVADTVVPRDKASHTVQARWHLKTRHTQVGPVRGMVVTADEGQPNLAVVGLLSEGLTVRTASGQAKPEILGVLVEKHGPDKYRPTTTVLHERKGAGVQQMLTLLLPLRRGAKCPVKSVRSTGATTAEVTLTDGRVWHIEADPKAAGGMRFVEKLADGAAGRDVRAGDGK